MKLINLKEIIQSGPDIKSRKLWVENQIIKHCSEIKAKTVIDNKTF